MDVSFSIGEVVNFLSMYDHKWKLGRIKYFTQDGMRTVAVIDEPDRSDVMPNKIPLNDKHIQKLVR